MHTAGPALIKPVPHVEAAGSGGKVKKRLLYLVQIVDRNVGKIMPEVQKLFWGEQTSSLPRDHRAILPRRPRNAHQLTTFPYSPLTAASWPLYSTRNQPFGNVKPK